METGLSTFSFQHVTIHSINSLWTRKERQDGFLPSLARLHLAWGQVSWKSNAPWEIILFSLGPWGIQVAQWSLRSLLHPGGWRCLKLMFQQLTKERPRGLFKRRWCAMWLSANGWLSAVPRRRKERPLCHRWGVGFLVLTFFREHYCTHPLLR